MKIKLVLLLIFWALTFFIIGLSSSKANMFTDPTKMYMPGNIYNTAIRNSITTSNNINKFDNCKIPGSVRKIVVEKSNKKMYLLDINGCVVKEYNIVTGKNPGPKQCDGDKKTPKGTYQIIEKRDSKYHKFLALDYPRAKDIRRARELGCKPGDSIGIHSWVEGLDRTGSLGCIRVWTRAEILEINDLVSVGTEVEIKD